MGHSSSSSTINYDEKENIRLDNSDLTKLPFSPSPENKIKFLYLPGNKISSLSSNMKNIILIDLTNNSLCKSLPSEVASALSSYSNLKTLYLSKNKLENFNNFENSSVETIFITQNHFNELPHLSKYPLLKSLYLDSNFISALRDQSSEKIVTLILALNCIRTIDASTLNLPQLMTLDLSKNNINVLPNNFSKSFPKLQNLNLSDNFIKEIPDDDSMFPETLTELNLKNNLIEKVPKSITSLPKLKMLNIENNKITAVPQLNQSIEKLFTSNNKINKIESQELNLLNELQIDNNELTSFPTEINFSKLNSIYLHHNKISQLDFNSISVNNILTKVDISFNNIEKVPKELFECLPNLFSFSAYFNKITSIPSEISNCKNLSNLEISFNPIKKFPKLPRSLSLIYASNCQIESFDESCFCDPIPPEDGSQIDLSFKLRHLDLSGNEIESFSIIPSIELLNLSQNKINKMPSITDKLRILDLSMNKLDSSDNSMPEFISGSSLIDINLSHNKLTKIPQFTNVPILQYIEISGNKISGDFDITNFGLLERIDISETDISIVGQNDNLNEIISSKRNKIESLSNKYIYLNLNKSGYSEMLGSRDKMEDSIIVRDDLNLYAVCDGHGGSETAKFAAIEISNLFESKIQKNQLNFDKPSEIFLEIFQKVESMIEKNKLKDGSTLCLACICNDSSKKRKIITAHLGDARALIVRTDGKSRELTKDHKPSMRSEFERIHNISGYLSRDNRVDGRLAVARSLGDFDIYGVGKEPDVNEFEIDENDKYLVICCDGVFDVLSNDDVAKITMNSASTNEAAFKIRNAAFGCMSFDNISAIVVDLSQ